MTIAKNTNRGCCDCVAPKVSPFDEMAAYQSGRGVHAEPSTSKFIVNTPSGFFHGRDFYPDEAGRMSLEGALIDAEQYRVTTAKVVKTQAKRRRNRLKMEDAFRKPLCE